MRFGVFVCIGRCDGSNSPVRNNDDRRNDLIDIPYLGVNVILNGYVESECCTHSKGETVF